jgi:hypothetical protein
LFYRDPEHVERHLKHPLPLRRHRGAHPLPLQELLQAMVLTQPLLPILVFVLTQI